METMLYKGCRIEIDYDSESESPREWDNLGHMVCFHGRYHLGDDDHNLSSDDFNGWDELEQYIYKLGATVVLPLYLYDHSGITMSVGPFSCSWDSGQVGFIYVTPDDVRRMGIKNFRHAYLEKQLKAEVETYDQFLRGDVYGYRIFEDPESDECVDSCWGYFGEEYCLEEAKSIVDYITTEKATA